MTAVDVAGLDVRYGSVPALEDVTLRVGAGRVCALVGVNGSGKSSLLGALTGLVRAERGTVRLLGEDPARACAAQRVAYVPQADRIDPTFPVSVGDVVATGRYGHLGLTRRLRARDREAVATALARVGLTDLADRPIGALSGGQRKRAFVARGLAQGAELVLLDEPFAGVDVGSQETVVRLLRALAAEGRTVLIATHDLVTLPELADETVLLRRRVLFHGPTAEALRPARLATALGLAPVGEVAR